MSLWKLAKDKAVIDRLLDERMHALAVREIESGIRRDGLWAKALIQAGPDEPRAKLAYLGLLVQHLKDEQYITEREREEQAVRQQTEAAANAEAERRIREQRARDEACARAQSQYTQANLNYLLNLCKQLRANDLEFHGYESLAKAIGASLRYEGFIWGKYVVTYGNSDIKFENLPALRPWFIEHALPAIEARA